jgi:lipoprotein-anchoring transpeptidase ErfK/SrfK
MRLWRDYKELGGPAQLGFPISSRYDAGGITYQALQAAVLRWNASAGFADVFPIFSALATLNLDDWLEARGIPRTLPELLENPDLPVETRLSWLTHPVLRQVFMEPSQATGMARLGLPMSEPQRFGPYLAQRFEKAALQLWLDDVPDQPAAGTVSMIQVGDLLVEAELIPEDALVPQAAPAPRPVSQTIPGAGQTPAVSFVTPGAGKYIVVSLGRQWWYAYQDGQQVYSGPVTTGQPALPTPAGHFSVLSRHSPYTMISPWPPGSPFYYPPSGMTYALQITGNGVFLHDAPWRPYYGPGTNFGHVDPDGVYRTGSHGCINLPYSAAAWLWNFAPVGTPVDVIA